MAYSRAILSILGALSGVTANTSAAAQNTAERQASLDELFARASAADIARDRAACANGQQPAAIARSRAAGAASLPDAADLCVTVLIRVARDGNLLTYYRGLTQQVTGSAVGYERVPEAVGAAVTQQRADRVAIGNGVGTVITPALALDAGFSAAYANASAVAPGLPAMASLRPVAERCLGQAEPRLALCYAAGYALGARAAHGERVRVP